MEYHYRYSLYEGSTNRLLFKLYEYNTNNSLDKTAVIPSTIFSNNNISSYGSGFYKLDEYSCSKNVDCSFVFNFVNNPPQGNYLAETYLLKSGVIISRDHFNFIIK